MNDYTYIRSTLNNDGRTLVTGTHGPGDHGMDWHTAVTTMMDSHPELYPTHSEARQQLSAMTAIEIAQWRYNHRFPCPIARDPASTAALRARDLREAQER